MRDEDYYRMSNEADGAAAWAVEPAILPLLRRSGRLLFRARAVCRATILRTRRRPGAAAVTTGNPQQAERHPAPTESLPTGSLASR